MIMETKKCVICYSKIAAGNSQESHLNIKTTKPNTSVLNQQLVVIFLVRKLFKTPQGVCLNFLKDYGNPCEWIRWCDSCAFLVEKAKSVYDQILSLREQFHSLQLEFRTTFQLSRRNSPEFPGSRISRNEDDSDWGATEIVRECFTQKHYEDPDCVEDLITEFKKESSDSDEAHEHFQVGNEKAIQDPDDIPISDSLQQGADLPDIEPSPELSSKVQIRQKIISTPLQNSSLYNDESLKSLLTKLDNIIYSKSDNGHNEFKLNEENSIAHGKNSGTGSQKSANSNVPIEIPTKLLSIRLQRIPIPIKNCQQNLSIDQESDNSDLYRPDDASEADHSGEYDPDDASESDHSDVYKPDDASESDEPDDKLRGSRRRHPRNNFKSNKKFKCDLCWYSCSTIYRLKDHFVKTHGELPITCENCNEKFLNESEMRKHRQRFHSSAHKFSCPKCNKAFMANDTLRKHCKEKHAREFDILFPVKRVVRNLEYLEKPHSCQKCKKRFLLPASLRKHCMKHHADDYQQLFSKNKSNITCDVCNENFRSTWKLKSHYEKEHPDTFKTKYFYGDKVLNPCPHCPFKTVNTNYLLFHINKHSYKQTTGEDHNISTLEDRVDKDSTNEKHLQVLQSQPIKHSTANESPELPVDEENFSESGEFSEKGTRSSKENAEDATTGKKEFKCEMCPFSHRKLDSLKVHFLNFHGELPFSCEKCCAKMVNEQQLKKHNEIYHRKTNKFSCPKCFTKSYATERSLRQHFKKEHPNDSEIILPSKLAKRRLPTEDLFEKCSIEKCGKRFAHLGGLKGHYRRFHPEDLFHLFKKTDKTCDICDNVFVTMRDLKSHFEQEHPKEFQLRYFQQEKNKVHPCPQCPFKTKSKTYLEQHINKHGSARPYICDLCGVTFKNAANLRDHRHSKHYEKLGLEPFKCRYCGKMFQTPAYLQTHTKMHLGQYKYHCTICNRGFAVQNALNYHVLRHKGEKPHLCDLCGKSFLRKSSLTIHIRGVHSGEKSFPCNKCNKSFSSPGMLKRHDQGVHSDGTNPHECKICHKKFPVRNYLYIHMRSHKKRGEVPSDEELQNEKRTRYNAIKIVTQN